MKVMLTPPDLWGSTGYVSQGDTGAPGATQTLYQVHTGHRLAIRQPLPQVRHSSEDESKETAAENIILINRQRQVGHDSVFLLDSSHRLLCLVFGKSVSFLQKF